MKIIKRSGTEVPFDIEKIVRAIEGANSEADPSDRLTDDQIALAAHSVEWLCERAGHTVSVEEIQDMVENQIMAAGALRGRPPLHHLPLRAEPQAHGQHHRRPHPLPHRVQQRGGQAGELQQEPHRQLGAARLHGRRGVQGPDHAACCCRRTSSRRTRRASSTSTTPTTSRSTCTTATWSTLRTCCRTARSSPARSSSSPHSFSTACNIATQIIAQVASCQYGGQSISLDASGPVRRGQPPEDPPPGAAGGQRARRLEAPVDKISKVVEERLRDEIRRGVQTIQYQVVTLMTTNGQAPFVTVFMYLGEARSEAGAATTWP